MLVFVDESEFPSPSRPGGYTLYSGAVIDPRKSKSLSREIFVLNKKFWDINEPQEFEIKGHLLLNNRAMTSPKKLEYVDEILSLCKSHGVLAFAVGLGSSPATLPGFADKAEFKMLVVLLERIEMMMQEQYPSDMATLVFDSRGEGTDKSRALTFGNFIYGHSLGSNLHQIVDTPLFVSSSITVGIQIADLFAYVLAQYNLGRHETKLFRIVERIRELEWRSNRMDVEYPKRGFRFIDSAQAAEAQQTGDTL